MKIITWNVDWYRNGRRSGKDGEYLEVDSSSDIYKKIKSIIVKFLDEDSGNMVCLQEVPYKVGDKTRNHDLYNEMLHEDLNFKKGTFKANRMNIWAYARTMVISQDKWKNSNDEYSGDKSNHIIQIEKDQVKIMALHIPPIQIAGKDVKDASTNTDLWTSIIDKCKKSKPQIVLGDFNVDDPQTEQFKKLQELMKLGYCEPDGEAKLRPTFKDLTHIDYILVRNDLKDRVKSYKVFEKGHGLSDHEPLIIDIDI